MCTCVCVCVCVCVYNLGFKNTITEMKNTLKGINGRICEAEEWISELEDSVLEITAAEQNKENRMKRSEDRLRDN